MDLSKVLKEARKQFGLTQIDVSRLSNVSLPFIQNMERGTANPSVKTLESILGVLGLRLELNENEPSWDLLAALGLPLSASADMGKIVPTAARLENHLQHICLYLLKHKAKLNGTREYESVQALLFAIKEAYPGFYQEAFGHSPSVKSIYPKEINGRLIKLKRIAVSKLSEYL